MAARFMSSTWPEFRRVSLTNLSGIPVTTWTSAHYHPDIVQLAQNPGGLSRCRQAEVSGRFDGDGGGKLSGRREAS
jgi:hypothetical protein